MVTVYSLPACVQCDTTKRFLQKNGIEYTEVNIAEDRVAYEKIKSMGYTQAPVVEFGGESWSGFRLEMLNKLAA